MAKIPAQDEFIPMGDYFLIRAKFIDVEGVRLDRVINQVKSSIEAVKTDLNTKEDDIKHFKTWAEYEAAKNSVPAGAMFVVDEDNPENQIPKHNLLEGRDEANAHPYTAIEGLQAQLDKKTDVAKTQTLESRMNQFAKLPSGSTAGDAELADIRVGADGKTYENAGEAVRGQVSSLKETIDAFKTATGIQISAQDDKIGKFAKRTEILELFKGDVYSVVDFGLISQNGDALATEDDADDTFSAELFSVKTDPTLTEKNIPADAAAVRAYVDSKQLYSFEKYSDRNDYFTSAGLPILYLSGDTTGMTKSVAKDMTFQYKGDNGTCTVKWQGSSSLNYPKKNFTVKFDHGIGVKAGWGLHKKYVLKANYIDFSHARNVVCARLWGQIVRDRIGEGEARPITDQADNNIVDDNNNFITAFGSKVTEAPNAGAVDGFPIMLVINNEYVGLYNISIPKDDWLYAMGNGESEMIISTEDHTQPTRFKQTITISDFESEKFFSKEYASENVTDQRIVDSLNTMIMACMDATGENYRETIDPYVDVESAIDYYVFSVLITNYDGIDKNYLLYSYDGVKFGFGAYDMDSTFGNNTAGNGYQSAKSGYPTINSYDSQHRLMHLIRTYDKETFKKRYEYLRQGILSEDNIQKEFSNYMAQIPMALKNKEVELWPSTPGTDTNNLAQIVNNYRIRCLYMDTMINSL